jgi:RNA polymerase sigma factor (sigma-70 family)
MIKVLLADDQKILREGLKMIMAMDEELQVVGVAENGEEAVFLAKELSPDVIVMDIKMPKIDGVEATRLIHQENEKIRIIMLTTFKDEEYIQEAIRYGAMGYLLKDATPEEIIEAVKKVHAGGALMDPDVANIVLNKMSDMMNHEEESVFDTEILSERERQIVFLLTEGMSNREISEELHLSEGTVKNNISRILDKLTLRDRTQLALFGVKYKIKE